MTPLDTFLAKLAEYATNSISALDGKTKFTANERDDLKRMFDALPEADRVTALSRATDKGLDVANWMKSLDAFLAKLSEYATNNISALDGHIQFTHNEREDLKLYFAKLDRADRPTALTAAAGMRLDTSTW